MSGEEDGLVVVPVDDDCAELLCAQRDCLMYAEPVGSAHQHTQGPRKGLTPVR